VLTPVPVAPGTLMDGALMMTGPDLADLITLAEARGGKGIVAETSCNCRRCRMAAACRVA
jgi:hypothetical protein